MNEEKKGPAYIADATTGSFITFRCPLTGETVTGMIRAYEKFNNGRSPAVAFIVSRNPRPYRVAANFHVTIL